MKERPILFSAPMVRAILAGTKTQTRRALNHEAPDGVDDCCWLDIDGIHTFAWLTGEDQDIHPSATQFPCPYGQPGDRLWVREAWTAHAFMDAIPPRDLTTISIHYQADGQIQTGKNRPGMFMPRRYSRITLEVTDVRVERLQDISKADALAEGIAYSERFQGFCIGEAEHFNSHDPRESFWSLWEAINGAGSVEANPWVWVINFRRAP